MANEQIPLLDFSRNTAGTFWDANGVLQTAGIDEIRPDYDPATGRYRGMLLEQETTRLSPYSSDFSNRGAYGTTVTATGNGVKGLAQSKVVPSATEESNYVNLGTYNADSVTRVFSVVVSAAEYSLIRMNIRHTYLDVGGAHFDIRNGSILIPNHGSAIEPLGDGLFRCSILLPCTSASSNRGYLAAIPSNDLSNYSNFAGDGVSGIYLYHAQVEVGATPSSIILGGEGSPATRARDDARLTDPSVLNDFVRGTFVVEWETLANKRTDNSYILSPEGSKYEFLGQRAPNGEPDREHFTYIDGGYLEYPDMGRNVSVVSWDGSTVRTASNGSEVHEFPQTNQFPASALEIGGRNNTWSGWIKSLRFIPRAVPAAELQSLTQVD